MIKECELTEAQKDNARRIMESAGLVWEDFCWRVAKDARGEYQEVFHRLREECFFRFYRSDSGERWIHFRPDQESTFREESILNEHLMAAVQRWAEHTRIELEVLGL